MEQKLVGPSKQLKQLIQTEHNIVKNLKWPEETSWLFASMATDLNSGLPRNTSGQRSEQDLNLGPLDCDFNTLTTQPHCLHPLLGHCARIVVTK